MPFFATMPTTMISPMKEEMLNVVPVISSARKTPDVESSADERIASGAPKLPNSKSSTDEHQHHRQYQYHAQIAKRLLLLFVTAAVHDANAGRNVQIGQGFLHRRDARAQIHTFQPRRHCEHALQIFAQNFGLARKLLNRRERTQAWPGCRLA